MKISKALVPPDSILNSHSYDYVDSFQGVLNVSPKEVTSTDLGKAFFASAPDWLAKLFALRNKIVGIFGLKISGKVENRQQLLDSFTCSPGERLGLFQVFDRTENEVILGEDDSHLNFRVSLFIQPHAQNTEQSIVIISTTVVFNNWLGKLYFTPVRPFHKRIVPVMLKGTIEQLEKQKLEKN